MAYGCQEAETGTYVWNEVRMARTAREPAEPKWIVQGGTQTLNTKRLIILCDRHAREYGAIK